MDTFQKSLIDPKHEQYINMDTQDRINTGITGTPILFWLPIEAWKADPDFRRYLLTPCLILALGRLTDQPEKDA